MVRYCRTGNRGSWHGDMHARYRATIPFRQFVPSNSEKSPMDKTERIMLQIAIEIEAEINSLWLIRPISKILPRRL
jgi:hypothetical protein